MAHVHVRESRGVPCDLTFSLSFLNYPARWATRLDREFPVGSRRATTMTH